jgi:phospholipase C
MAGNSRHGFAFDQLGVRVPAIVVSPYTPRGTIDHTVHEHTSVPATLERLFDLAPLTRRDAGAPGLQHLFGLASARQDAPPRLPAPAASGVPDCAEDLDERLAGELERAPGHLAGSIDSALVGFLHVAIARELHLAAQARGDLSRAVEQERDRLLSTYDRIRTKFDAARYIREVQKRFQAARG